jgi:aminopeptidase N
LSIAISSLPYPSAIISNISSPSISTISPLNIVSKSFGLLEYIGYEKFRDGLRYYLKKHSYKNTHTKDLWEAFERVSGKPIKKMMQNWTQKTGYPIISLLKKGENFEIRQDRFLSSRISAKKTVGKTIWQVPIRYENNNSNSSILLTKKSLKIKSNYIGKLNIGEGSFIRTCYSEKILKDLGEKIYSKKMSVKDRLGLARDIFALAEAGYIKTNKALEFSLYYKNEDEYIVWSELASGINKLYRLISDEKFEDKYKSYSLSIFSPLAEKIGFEVKENEKHSTPFLRNLAIANAAAYGDKKIIKEACEMFDNRIKKPIRADIRSTIYGIVAANGEEKSWEEFVKLYKNESFHEEKDRIGYALTRFKDKKILEKTLEFALSKEVRDQDSPFMIAQVWQNINGRNVAWKFVKKNWKEIVKRYGEGGFISRLLSPLEGHKTKEDLEDIKKFFNKNIAPGADRTLEQAYERIGSNIAWLRSDKKSIEKWLDENF